MIFKILVAFFENFERDQGKWQNRDRTMINHFWAAYIPQGCRQYSTYHVYQDPNGLNTACVGYGCLKIKSRVAPHTSTTLGQKREEACPRCRPWTKKFSSERSWQSDSSDISSYRTKRRARRAKSLVCIVKKVLCLYTSTIGFRSASFFSSRCWWRVKKWRGSCLVIQGWGRKG